MFGVKNYYSSLIVNLGGMARVLGTFKYYIVLKISNIRYLLLLIEVVAFSDL